MVVAIVGWIKSRQRLQEFERRVSIQIQLVSPVDRSVVFCRLGGKRL